MVLVRTLVTLLMFATAMSQNSVVRTIRDAEDAEQLIDLNKLVVIQYEDRRHEDWREFNKVFSEVAAEIHAQ
jgi:hypothetical protein